jgi:hypothetical protein
MITKGQAYVRNWQWNNSWYLQQERPVNNYKIKEALVERGIPVYTPDELISPFLPRVTMPPEDEMFDNTRISEQKRDETHPFWKDEPMYSYHNISWQPKDNELTFARAMTNTVASSSLPDTILNRVRDSHQVSEECKRRVENVIQTCCIGDATQVLLPKNFKVPFIGWHPVESTMVPRNQYDWKAFSWGRNMPREYGIPNTRKIGNINRGLFKQMCTDNQVRFQDQHYLEGSKIRQFIRRPDGKLVRFYLNVPFVITSANPLQNIDMEQSQYSGVPDVSPLDPLAGLKEENVYELKNNYPVLSTQHTHPYIHTVFRHNVGHIAPKFEADKETAKCLIQAYAAAIGQARLLYGADYKEDLRSPITINSISTNGAKYIVTRFQLNSLDLNSSTPNLFSYNPDILDLYEFCGYEDGRVAFSGLNIDTYRLLEAVMLEKSVASSSVQSKKMAA